MFLSDASVKRPVAMSCLIIALSALGINAFRKISLELFPSMDIPVISVTTQYPGASPSDIEVDVAKRIEDAVASTDGLKHLSSSCLENVCITTLEFYSGTNIDIAATDVREYLNTILDDFPIDVEMPTLVKVDVNSLPVVNMALGGTATIEALYDYADESLSDQLAAISGVAQVDILGGATRELSVQLERKELAAAGITSYDVAQAISTGVLAIPAGRVWEAGTEYSVRFDAEYHDVSALGDLQVVGNGGQRRYIRDLGEVKMGSEERRQASFINGLPCIGIQVVKRSDANTVAVVNRVREAYLKYQDLLPGGMELIWISDNGDFIESSVSSTTSSVWQGVLMTAIILFLFLFNLRSTFIVAITMPLTIIIGFFFIQQLGYSLNMITLSALGLSVGVLVTNSIVVLENILSHFMEDGDSWRSAKDGAGEVAVAVCASAGTNMVVLLPIAMMSSNIAMVFRPFAWVTLVVNMCSLFISFTLTPILCGILLKKQHEESWIGKMSKKADDFFVNIGKEYQKIITFFSKTYLTTFLVLLAAIGIFVGTMAVVPGLVGFEAFPQMDQGLILVKLEYPTSQDLNKTITRVKEVEKLISDFIATELDEEANSGKAENEKTSTLKSIFTNVGKVSGSIGRATEGVYLASIQVKVVDKVERTWGISEMLPRLREALVDHTDCIVNVSVADFMGSEDLPIDMMIAGSDLATLEDIAIKVVEIANTIPGIEGADSSVRKGKPQVRILPNRTILNDFNLPVSKLASITRTNLEGEKVATYKSGSRSFDIRVKFRDEQGRNQVEAFMIPGSEPGQMLPITTFATVEDRRIPVLINRMEKSLATKFYSYLSPDLPLGTAVDLLSKAIDDTPNLIKPGYYYEFRGDYEFMSEGMDDFMEAGILAIGLTYLVLAAILESFTRPFYILCTIPLGLVGMYWALLFVGQSFGLMVALGAVMLVGIVVNCAVLIIDRADQLSEKHPPGDAMIMAAADQFRSVAMITLAAVLGMVPLATASGQGSEALAAIGSSSIGGILVSAALTLIVLPTSFLLFFRPGGKVTQKKHRSIDDPSDSARHSARISGRLDKK